MRNKTLSLIKGSIPYMKELNQISGSVNATLLMQQLDYWFSKTEFAEGFFKFKAPCTHPHYKQGDSWQEELGFSERELQTALSLICQVYKSKREMRAHQSNLFQGKFYASYYDRATHLTYYFRNHAVLDQALEQLFHPQEQTASFRKPRTVDYSTFHLPPLICEPSITETAKRRFLYHKDTETTTETTVKEKIYKKENQTQTEDRREKIFPLDQTERASHKPVQSPVYPETFQQFWFLYPRKEAKEAAYKAFRKALQHVTLEVLLEAVRTYTAHTEAKFCVQPHKWLNDGRWMDERDTPITVPESASTLFEQIAAQMPSLQSESPWQNIAQALSRKIGMPQFVSWFKEALYQGIEDQVLTLKVKNRFLKDTIESQFESALLQAAQLSGISVQTLKLVTD